MNMLLLNGPNLNMLGVREPETYGTQTLGDIEKQLTEQAEQQGCMLTCLQSNAEHVLVDAIQQAYQKFDFMIINPAAFTHTSVALRDALLAVTIPFIEVHLSDPRTREAFRHHSYFSDIAIEVIKGQGAAGYSLALEQAIRYCQRPNLERKTKGLDGH